MKKLFTLLMLSVLLGNVFASTPVKETPKLPKASEIMIPVGQSGKTISLMQLATIKQSDLEELTGRKMNAPERFAFRSAQRKINRGINSQGEITSKKMKKMFYADGETGFHIGGFALGFLVGLIGVLIAYLINDDKKKNRVKWAWIGFGAFLAIYLIVLASVL